MRHRHPEFKTPPPPNGRPINRKLLGRFVGAMWDGCTSCEEQLLAVLANDAVTVGGMVHLACTTVEQAFGGLPPDMVEPGIPGPASPQFRELARVGGGGNEAAMYAACERMTPSQRKEVACSAAVILNRVVEMTW